MMKSIYMLGLIHRHATLACYRTMQGTNLKVRITGLEDDESHQSLGRETKIALRCSNEQELLTLQAQARRLNLGARSIQDA
jgi:PTH2 family peptidyl-tRNA hydrolase